MKLPPKAKKLWENIPQEVRVKLLNNVWCTSCSEMTGIGQVIGKVVGGDLVLHGVCTGSAQDVVARSLVTLKVPRGHLDESVF